MKNEDNIVKLDNLRADLMLRTLRDKTDREVYDLDSVSISLPGHILMETGDYIDIPLSWSPTICNAPVLNWENSDIDVALIKDGKIKALKPGTTEVKALVAENTSITATSVISVYSQIPTYSVTLGCDTTMGSVSGGGTFRPYTQTTISAVPNSGYEFVKWSDNDTTNPRTIEVTGNLTLNAVFESEIPLTDTIYYTTTDGSVAVPNPNATAPFGVDGSGVAISIVSNTYSGGRGTLVLSASVSELGELAFGTEEEGYVSKIKTITLSSNVTSIGKYAFSKNPESSEFVSITAPGLVKIEDGAFNGNTGITTVVFTSGLKKVGNSAFRACSGITSVDFPDTLENFGDSVFNGSLNLTSFTCRATTPPSLGNDTFGTIPATCSIYVPSESVSAYKAASGWSSRADYIFAI